MLLHMAVRLLCRDNSASSSPLGRPLQDLLGRLGAVFGASWAVLNVVKAETSYTLKCTFSCGNGTIVASWGPLGRPLGGALERLEAI